MTKRILSVDYGEVRTGLAVSDQLGMMAHRIGTVKTGGFKNLIAVISEKIAEYNINLIVIGNPINMNGTFGEKSETVSMLAERIKTELNVDVVLFDERLTTASAHEILSFTDIKSKKRKAVIDTLSAEIILQNYLDSNRSDSK